MVLMARKFLLFIIIAAVIHITGLICQYCFRISNDVREQNIQKIPSKYQLHKSKSKKVISLSDLVVCNSSVIEELHKQATTVHDIQENALMCPLVAPDLGPVEKDAAIMNLRGIEDMVLRISAGGVHVPDCVAQQQVAIVLAVNDNIWKSIGKFIFYIHPFLMKQQLEYQIFVVHKIGSPGGAFERGKLFNIGFVEAQNYLTGGWDCFIFHDVNLLPLDTRNLYRCSRRPKKLISDFRKPYRFGGAVAISPQHFVQVDGFSNRVWSNYDGDYIDMYKRIMAANLTIESNFNHFGTYTTFDIAYYNLTTKSVTNAVRSSQRKGGTQYVNRTQRRNMLQRNQTHSSSNLKDGISSLFYSNSSTFKMEQFYSVIEVQCDDEQIL